MNADGSRKRYLLLFGFAVFTLAPSFDTALKYLGPAGVPTFFVVGTLLIFAADRSVIPIFGRLVSERTATILAVLFFAVITVAALVVYPAANDGRFGGGSDADDALVIAGSELIKGNYPYGLTTPLGNLISPMPGTIFLALPFALSGFIHLQNIFWLGVVYFLFRHESGGSRSSILLIVAMFIFSPTLQQNVATGADYASNSIYVLTAMWLLLRSLADETSGIWARILPAILLGIGLSSRSTFMLGMPLLLSALVQNAGWPKALKYLCIAGSVCLTVTLPFWLYDPSRFAPFIVQSDKLRAISDTLPYASILIPGISGLVATLLSFQHMRGNIALFLRNFAIVQIVALFSTSIVYSIQLGRLDFFVGQSGYGMFSMFFGATAFWLYLYHSGPNGLTQEEA